MWYNTKSSQIIFYVFMQKIISQILSLYILNSIHYPGILTMIMIRTLRRDIARYTDEDGVSYLDLYKDIV